MVFLAMNRLTDGAESFAADILLEHWPLVEAVAEKLLEIQDMDRETFEKIVKHVEGTPRPNPYQLPDQLTQKALRSATRAGLAS